ncbi:MAG: N-acetylmuramoyl-L-alanine amidase [Hyphomicrobiales bacterium]
MSDDIALSPDSLFVADVIASPNHGERRDGRRPDMIILHYTGMPDAASAVEWLCRAESEVSAHYVVDEDGRVLQLVAEGRRAWHAGKSAWGGECDINSASIGIEIVNPGHEFGYRPFPEEQIEAVIGLCLDISLRHGIAPHRVLGHSDVAPMRKTDPGELFPWVVLADAGVGHYVPPQPIGDPAGLAPGSEGPAVRALQALLSVYGYDVRPLGQFDEQTEAVVRAFQRHFRPARVDGVADASTVRTLKRLIDALPDVSDAVVVA